MISAAPRRRGATKQGISVVTFGRLPVSDVFTMVPEQFGFLDDRARRRYARQFGWDTWLALTPRRYRIVWRLALVAASQGWTTIPTTHLDRQ